MDWKKILLVVAIVGIFGGYFLYQWLNGSAAAPAINNTTGSTPAQQNGGSSGSSGNPSPGTLTDGKYQGDAVDSFYGTVQVQAVISGGKLTDIQLLQYPNSGGHTTEVSNSSLPVLKTEAIAAQSATIDVVSGATQTSQGFMKSLQSALVKAGSTENSTIQVTPPQHLPM